MAPKFREGSRIQREIKLYGVSAQVIVIIDAEGIQMAVKGSRKHIYANWRQIAESLNVPEDAPSFLMGKPLDFLSHQAAKRNK